MRLYGSLCVLCFFCLIRANVAEYENHSFSGTRNVERTSVSRSIGDLNNNGLNIVDKFRDKRALGLILSGLAQVFGYTVTPIQIASLPNPNPKLNSSPTDNNTGATGNNQSSSMPPTQSSTLPSKMTLMSTTTPALARQRETIRFTGVVNFGNRSDLLGHLQQYESIFHGGGTTTAAPSPMSSSSSSSSTSSSFSSSSSSTLAPSSTMSMLNLRDPLKYKPPLLSPFLVKIPLPVAPNLPPPMSPATEMINYSYIPTPRWKEQETVYRKNEDVENYSVENTDIQSEKEIGTPESKFQHNLYVDEPYWKKLHEDRISQLERQQQEKSTARLKEQEEDYSYEKEDNSEDENTDERSKNREKESNDREREQSESFKEEKGECGDENKKEEEDENSQERYKDLNEHRDYPRKRPTNEKEEDKGIEGYKDYDEDDSYRNYERHEDSKESDPRVYDNNYTNVKHDQPLPISDYYERYKSPQQLRDSYGEILNNQGLIDGRIANYFDKIKNQQNGVHTSERIPEFVGQSEERYEERLELKKNKENDEDPYKRIRDEYAIPFIETRYEEYNIKDDGRTEREHKGETENRKYVNDNNRYDSNLNKKNRIPNNDSTTFIDNTMQVDSNELRSKKTSKFRNNVSPAKNKPFEDFAFVKHTPYILPFRYVFGPEKLEEARMRRFNSLKSKKDNDSSSTADAERLAAKPKAKDLTPKIGLPERLMARKLHEGEQKEFQIWPAPFNFVFDSTEQTNVIVPSNMKENSNEKVYRTTNVPTSTVIYKRNVNSAGYFVPSIPVHYTIYQ
ncbi:hypothetical protein KPH14_009878 [Odynerus spinipes]|uniref:Uncharacterized protein n=1 Tax=Odynerus spinipes TaxID=1348599 RepID=A0AAD9VUU6_9HYME|nr:hypothetical protein KPH14_009878 [Odynerus spinipes]